MGRAAGSRGPPGPPHLAASAPGSCTPGPAAACLAPAFAAPGWRRAHADAAQSRRRPAPGTAPGARLANGVESGERRAGRLPATRPVPPASQRAAARRGPQPPARGGAFPVSLRQVATRPARELRILRAAGRGGAVRKKQSPPFASSALPAAVPGPGRAGWAARHQGVPTTLQHPGSPELMAWIVSLTGCATLKKPLYFPGSQFPLQDQRV